MWIFPSNLECLTFNFLLTHGAVKRDVWGGGGIDKNIKLTKYCGNINC